MKPCAVMSGATSPVIIFSLIEPTLYVINVTCRNGKI